MDHTELKFPTTNYFNIWATADGPGMYLSALENW